MPAMRATEDLTDVDVVGLKKTTVQVDAIPIAPLKREEPLVTRRVCFALVSA